MNFKDLGIEVGNLVEEKNTAYGDAFDNCGEFLKLIYPNGIKLEQYGDALAIVRVFDKLCRIGSNESAFSEEPWKDIAGYGLLGLRRSRNKESKDTKAKSAIF